MSSRRVSDVHEGGPCRTFGSFIHLHEVVYQKPMCGPGCAMCWHMLGALVACIAGSF
jgi:hypothetical protein